MEYQDLAYEYLKYGGDNFRYSKSPLHFGDLKNMLYRCCTGIKAAYTVDVDIDDFHGVILTWSM